jgi:arylsulfatase A-like enzyme
LAPARPRVRNVLQGIAAGLIAGGLAGMGEVILLATLGGSVYNLHAMLWAVVAYGGLGAFAGLALAVIYVLLRREPRGPRARPEQGGPATYAFTWAATFSVLGLLITRYRLYRDLFHESIRTFSLQGLAFNGGLLLFFVALFFLFYWLWQRAAFRLLTDLRGSGAVLALLVVVAGAASFFTRPTNTLSTAPKGIPPGLEDAPNVILIGVDTLRADRLSCYGHTASGTPSLDALAADGVRYADMTAQASWTKPSFATIFTSLYPSSHRATGKPHRLPEAVTTLAETLAASGYHTGGLANNPSISAAFGFDQGFADYIYLEPDYLFAANEAASQTALYQTLRRAWAMASGGRIYVQSFYQDAAVVNRHALDWLEANKGTRFFLFLHYMDPHDPYFEHPYDGRGYARASNQNPDPALAPTFSRLYDGEIRYLDEQLGQLFEWLKAEGLYDQTLIVLTGDHGEEFQEHGGWWHGQTLYQEQIAVPLIAKYPAGARAGTVITELARSLDIAPTILDVARVPIPETMMGRSLWSATEPPPSVFAEEDLEGNVVHALRTPAYKLILANPDNPRGLPAEVLFDLSTDPGEQSDLFAAQPDQVRSMRAALRQVVTLALERAVASEVGSLDASLQEKLHDLGY